MSKGIGEGGEVDAELDDEEGKVEGASPTSSSQSDMLPGIQ